MVKPGGAVASLEFLLPQSRFWRFWWWVYTRLVLPAGGWLTGGQGGSRSAGSSAPTSSAHYRRYPLDWTVEAWRRAGFVDVGVRRDEPRRGAGDVGAARRWMSAGAGRPRARARPAFYAARPGGWRDWWTLLHPPYTAWHLAYVVIGACLAPVVNITRLIATLLAFFFAVGLAAHALDELHGRPLRTRIPAAALVAVAGVGLGGAVALGIAGVVQVGPALVPFLVVGPLLVVGYNFELFGGMIHNDVGFAASWGAFPSSPPTWPRPAGWPSPRSSPPPAPSPCPWPNGPSARRPGSSADGPATCRAPSCSPTGAIPVERAVLLAPLEQALRAMSWAIVLVAAALAVARLG